MYIKIVKNDDLTADNFGRGIVGRPVFFIIFKIILFLYWSTEWTWRLIQFYIIRPAEVSFQNYFDR